MSQETHIRDATEQDVPRMAEIISRAREDAYDLSAAARATLVAGQLAAEGLAELGQQVERARRASESTKVWVAASDVDVALGVLIAQRQSGKIYLDRMFVDPVFQGKGIGSKLMEGFFAWAEPSPQWLEVIATNRPAVRFYEKHGFRAIAGSETAGNGKTYISMERGGDV